MSAHGVGQRKGDGPDGSCHHLLVDEVRPGKVKAVVVAALAIVLVSWTTLFFAYWAYYEWTVPDPPRVASALLWLAVAVAVPAAAAAVVRARRNRGDRGPALRLRAGRLVLAVVAVAIVAAPLIWILGGGLAV